MSDELKTMKQALLSVAQSQMSNLNKVNAEELGEVIDMIKDLEEAEYYCSIIKAMENNEKEDSQKYYTPYPYTYPYPRYTDNTMYYTDDKYPTEMRDYREGRSPVKRKGYIESKEMHKDQNIKMNELERYMSELANDLTEMILDASPEEKDLLRQKLTSFANNLR